MLRSLSDNLVWFNGWTLFICLLRPDHFQELFLESDLFWVEEGRGDGIISVNFEYFSHINYRLQTIWMKFCMGMNPTGSTDSHFVLSSVILFAFWLHHLIRMLPKLLHIYTIWCSIPLLEVHILWKLKRTWLYFVLMSSP